MWGGGFKDNNNEWLTDWLTAAASQSIAHYNNKRRDRLRGAFDESEGC
jgi:hypothetical protein